MSDALLEIEGVSVRRDGKLLLAATDLRVAPRTIHLVVGPNGAGKSTLVQAILGQVAFAGRIRMRWRGAGRVGLVPQRFEVDRTLPLTVAEFLALSRQRWPVCFGVRAATRARIAGLLERVGLPGLAERRMGVLSGGELRRVLLANAIDPVPELLLLDEPASGLDPAAVALVDGIIRELRDRDGVTALVVSHDREQLARLGDAVLTLSPPA